ncbi:hypothetical protein [Nonomuraea sp. NPDC049784]|uniref:hypothetical protein n=1 Tax=Nonomuraea sp. NPDC049784 TaxID=3154361 RepID=UPI0033DABCB9
MPYDSDEAFLRLAVPHVRSALAEGRHVLVITCAAKLSLLKDALGPDAGRIDVSTTWYGHPYRTLAAYHEYTRGRRTLVICEPSWARTASRRAPASSSPTSWC